MQLYFPMIVSDFTGMSAQKQAGDFGSIDYYKSRYKPLNREIFIIIL